MRRDRQRAAAAPAWEAMMDWWQLYDNLCAMLRLPIALALAWVLGALLV
jgi:hypothetical protein